MEEIKRLQRAGAWNILPDRYSSLRKLLRSILANHQRISDEHKSILVGAVTQFADMEAVIEKALSDKTEPKNVARLNQLLSKQADGIHGVFASLRSKESIGA